MPASVTDQIEDKISEEYFPHQIAEMEILLSFSNQNDPITILSKFVSMTTQNQVHLAYHIALQLLNRYYAVLVLNDCEKVHFTISISSKVENFKLKKNKNELKPPKN